MPHLKEDSPSLAVFEVLVELGDTNIALEFFRRYEGRYLHFCKLYRLKKRMLDECMRKDFETGKYTYERLGQKYGTVKTEAWQKVNNPSVNAKLSLELFHSVCELLGEEKAEEMFERFAGNTIILCKMDNLLREERNDRIRELYKKGVHKNDLAAMFKIGRRYLHTIIHGT